jgi:glutathione S-transferase
LPSPQEIHRVPSRTCARSRGKWSERHHDPWQPQVARLARILVLEKGLANQVEIVKAQTRSAGSPYYQINPSGRVPYLVDEAGVGMEDSQLICAYLDSLDGKPRFHHAHHASDWAYRRLEASARSMCDGISVWVREMLRPENERSPTALAHEVARARRMANYFEARASDPLGIGANWHRTSQARSGPRYCTQSWTR